MNTTSRKSSQLGPGWVWTVRERRGRPGVRGRLFAAVYGRLIDRAWPGFVASVAP